MNDDHRPKGNVTDYRPAFCPECGVKISVMKDQHGNHVIACGCIGPDAPRKPVELETWEETEVPGDP